jgi:zinc-finger of transposase IS204/IS1001/IS1096/IS1165
MRVADIFKRLLGMDGVRVSDVRIVEEPGGQVITLTVARRSNRRMHCSGCGQRARSVYDRQVRSWRHLDAFRVRCILDGRGAPRDLRGLRGQRRGRAVGPAGIPGYPGL